MKYLDIFLIAVFSLAVLGATCKDGDPPSSDDSDFGEAGTDADSDAGMASGYNVEVTAFSASSTTSKVTVLNNGIAPIYHDAFVTMNGVRAKRSLAMLVPGDSREYTVASGGDNPVLTIECDRLVPGQEIQFDADL